MEGMMEKEEKLKRKVREGVDALLELLDAKPPEKAKKKTSKADEDVSVPEALKDLPEYAADKKLCKAWDKQLVIWETAFPGTDIIAEVRKAYAWEMADPKRKKTLHVKFLTNWLSRAQDKAWPNRNDKLPQMYPPQHDKYMDGNGVFQ
jgi:hypothetical protein